MAILCDLWTNSKYFWIIRERDKYIYKRKIKEANTKGRKGGRNIGNFEQHIGERKTYRQKRK